MCRANCIIINDATELVNKLKEDIEFKNEQIALLIEIIRELDQKSFEDLSQTYEYVKNELLAKNANEN